LYFYETPCHVTSYSKLACLLTTDKCVYLATLVYPIFAPVTLTLTRWPWCKNLT